MIRLFQAITIASAAIVIAAVPARAQLIDTKVVSLQAAKTMVTAAEAEARKHSWTMVIAVVDQSGDLIALHRMDDVQVGSVDIAIAKARTAARFKRATKALGDALAAGNTGILSIGGAVALAGGVPIIVDGKVVGAVGCSGMAADQDAVVAQAGADAIGH